MKKMYALLAALLMFMGVMTSCDKSMNEPLSEPESFEVENLKQPDNRVLRSVRATGAVIDQVYKDRYRHKPDQRRSQVAAYVTAYNAVNNASKTLGEVSDTDETLETLAGFFSPNGGYFFSQSSGENGKRRMFNEIVDKLRLTKKPVVVYGKGETGVMGGLIVCAVDDNAEYNSTNKNIRYTDLRLEDATNTGDLDRFSANVRSMSVKTFIERMATSAGILNSLTW